MNITNTINNNKETITEFTNSFNFLVKGILPLFKHTFLIASALFYACYFNIIPATTLCLDCQAQYMNLYIAFFTTGKNIIAMIFFLPAYALGMFLATKLYLIIAFSNFKAKD